MDEQQLKLDLEREIRHWHRLRWLFTTIVGGILLVAVAMGAYQLHQDAVRLAASCSFYRDLSLAPVPNNPKPSQLGVHLLLDSRVAYYGEGCGPPLKPPSASLVHWASYYGLHVLP